MKQFYIEDYPIYIHTQPSSFKAIKLYSDFGFKLLKGGRIGHRDNELEKSLQILREFMTQNDFDRLEIIDTPSNFIKLTASETTTQF
jgi:hypothetical protein